MGRQRQCPARDGLGLPGVFFALSLILLVATIIVFMRHGRELKPEFQEKYWREAPDKKLHPAVVGRCWRFDKESTEDLTATLVHLSAIGAVAINKGTYEQKKHFGRVKEVEGLYLTRVPAVADTLTDPLDRKALELVFDTVGQGEDSLWMSSFTQFAADHPQEFKDAVDAWQGELTARTMRAELFEPKGPRRRTITTVAAVVYAIFGVVLSGMTMQVVPVLVTLPVAAVMLVLARFMERRTRAGAELNARSTALRNWLRDFTRTDEQPPTGVKVWGELLVYAYLFGVADEVIKQLKDVMPELFQEDAMVAGGYTYMPFFWFTDTGAGMGGGIGSMPSASDLFSTAVANSVSTIDAASSSFSDGFGGGGGFSMGGGGGFGGGGGAR